MKTFFIGIDISKSWLDLVICDENQSQLEKGLQINNDSKTIEEYCDLITSMYPDVNLWF
jgi:hypothetical protein